MQVQKQDLPTLAIHAGTAPDPTTGAILTPIYQSTTFVQPHVGANTTFTYSRSANPTVTALEHNIGALENCQPAVCFSTGMAAFSTLCMTLLKAGDRIVASTVLYGGTHRFLREVASKFGVTTDFVDTGDLDQVEPALKQPTRLLVLESPANPTLRLTDIKRCVEIAKTAGAQVVLDNTFLTPVLQRSFELGADIVLHSTTKYLDGHNATTGGALCTQDAEQRERFHWGRQAIGTIQSPMNAWLTLQGIKTLPLRMRQHSENALALATWLEAHRAVARVRYPGLKSFDQHDLAVRQHQHGHGGMVTVELCGGVPAAKTLMEGLTVGSLAENLGSAETLVTHPVTMTHAAVPEEVRLANGITDGLVRISVGLESINDLIADFDQALENLS